MTIRNWIPIFALTFVLAAISCKSSDDDDDDDDSDDDDSDGDNAGGEVCWTDLCGE